MMTIYEDEEGYEHAYVANINLVNDIVWGSRRQQTKVRGEAAREAAPNEFSLLSRVAEDRD